MADFYAWPWVLRTLITFLLALCVLAQTLAVILSFYSRRRLKALPELCALAALLFCSLLYGQAVNSVETGLLAPVGFGALRLGVQGRGWLWGFLAAMLFLLARGVWLCLRRCREITTGISALSVKNAIDSLRSGVLFSKPDGYILLSNAQMQRLMTAIAGRVQHNSRDFYALLPSDVCRLPDGSSWQFTKTEIRIGKKTYVQLTAADITERWALTEQLRRQNGQLAQKSEELKCAIASLRTLSREREAQKVKMRAHDILGQRLSLLLRTVRDAREVDYNLLRGLSQGLLDALKEDTAPCAQDFLDRLRQEFDVIGVGIRLEGPLPGDRALGELFADIVREGATNAVRHGLATQVLIQLEHEKDVCHMRITNNGPPPPENIREGEGLGGIRKKVTARGGALRVVTRPRFALEIDIPGGGQDI
ncbi:MAG: hypothetical protein FWC27_12160 [Firmicutes bacterium]|nr:hypothetical protein [Bacillota bacterium]